jgi:quinol monooxygenase YgiN
MYVAGSTAANIDVFGKLGSTLPLFIAIIVVLAVILLAIAFRSLLVPLKAVIGFLLSVAASLGVVVFVFEYGHPGSAIGVAAAAPIVSFVPMLLIGVLFGLAMDYEVFLISRMREAFERDGDARDAVASGLERSGRVVVAAPAALIMTAVFTACQRRPIMPDPIEAAFVANGTYTIHPDDCERFAELVRPHVLQTMTEPGCVYYHFGVDVNDQTQFHIMEGWTSRQALDAHNATAEFRALLTKVSATIRVLGRNATLFTIAGQEPIGMPDH